MAFCHLNQEKRFYIQIQLGLNHTRTEIAKALKVSHTTVCREVQRNIEGNNNYNSDYAGLIAKERRSSSYKSTTENISDKVKTIIIDKLKVGSSPEVISGGLNLNDGINISKNTIYRFINQDRANNGKLYKLLPHTGKAYKINKSDASSTKIPNRIGIEERPPEAALKSIAGHLEMDTIFGKDMLSYLLTLSDKATKKTIIRKIKDKRAETIVEAIKEIMQTTDIPFKTITTDNGTEFAKHEEITKITGAKVYFTDPYSSWQKGLVEHMNGQIRIFFPKGTDFRTISDSRIAEVENILNNRPRKSLGFKSPNQVKLE